MVSCGKYSPYIRKTNLKPQNSRSGCVLYSGNKIKIRGCTNLVTSGQFFRSVFHTWFHSFINIPVYIWISLSSLLLLLALHDIIGMCVYILERRKLTGACEDQIALTRQVETCRISFRTLFVLSSIPWHPHVLCADLEVAHKLQYRDRIDHAVFSLLIGIASNSIPISNI